MSNKVIYKSIDLFGNETVNFVEKTKKSNKSIFDDYEGFVDKFEPKKTTDDCYTPSDVYFAVLDYVAKKVDLKGVEIIRPFYPGGNYELIDYADNCIVIDNPPFSIISKIARFYIKNNVKFFLFAPHLTLFSSDIDVTAIVCGASITYENGAVVPTSFLTNAFGDLRVLAAPSLYETLMQINGKNKVNLPKYEYPNEVLTVSKVQKMVENGVSFEVYKSDCRFCRGLDSQKIHKKAIFGNGFLLSEKSAAEKSAAEKSAAEKSAAEKSAAEKTNVVIWELSEKEKNIIKSMGDF